jgi:hypothetical protein
MNIRQNTAVIEAKRIKKIYFARYKRRGAVLSAVLAIMIAIYCMVGISAIVLYAILDMRSEAVERANNANAVDVLGEANIGAWGLTRKKTTYANGYSAGLAVDSQKTESTAIFLAAQTQKKPEKSGYALIAKNTENAENTEDLSCSEIVKMPDCEKPEVTDAEIDMLAKTVWGEGGALSAEEQALIVWCVFNRVDCEVFPDTIAAVITAKNQFHGYRAGFPVKTEIRALVVDEIAKWRAGKAPPVHEVYAPQGDYLYFSGRGGHNWFI